MKNITSRSLAALTSLTVVGGIFWLLSVAYQNNRADAPVALSAPKSDDVQTLTSKVSDPLMAAVSSSGETMNPLEQLENFKESLPNNRKYDEKWCFSEQLSQEDGEFATRMLKQWLKDRGYLLDEELASMYANYDDDTLQKLASDGDSVAFNILYKKLSGQKTAFIEAAIDGKMDKKAMRKALSHINLKQRALNIDAAAYGRTNAYTNMGWNTLMMAVRQLKKGDDEEGLRLVISGLGYFEAAYKLGDLTSLEAVRDFLWKRVGLELTSENLSEMTKSAELVAMEVEARRQELGLVLSKPVVPKIVRQMTAYRLYIDRLDESDLWTDKIASEYPMSGCEEAFSMMHERYTKASEYVVKSE